SETLLSLIPKAPCEKTTRGYVAPESTGYQMPIVSRRSRPCLEKGSTRLVSTIVRTELATGSSPVGRIGLNSGNTRIGDAARKVTRRVLSPTTIALPPATGCPRLDHLRSPRRVVATSQTITA